MTCSWQHWFEWHLLWRPISKTMFWWSHFSTILLECSRPTFLGRDLSKLLHTINMYIYIYRLHYTPRVCFAFSRFDLRSRQDILQAVYDGSKTAGEACSCCCDVCKVCKTGSLFCTVQWCSEVTCGGHSAKSCSECPQGNEWISAERFDEINATLLMT